MFERRRPICITIALAAIALCLTGTAREIDRLAGLAAIGKICGIPHVGIFGDLTTILANTGTALYYKSGDGGWARAPIELNRAHSISRLPNGRWLINDTDHHRVVQLDDLAGNGRPVVRSELAGIALRRPHDQIVDPSTGDIYVVAGDRRLFRFKDLEGPIDVWTFRPEELGYVRALSWFDGRLHVINSSRGEVLRIDDYSARRYTTFRSPRPKVLRGKPSTQIDPSESRDDFDAGALSTTGLIPNDVDKHGDWYYGTNDFLVDYAMGGDTGPARLIRWRSWPDFERGNWEDLSAHIPRSESPLVPYFITIHDDVLYTPLSKVPDDQCEGGTILRLDLNTLSAK